MKKNKEELTIEAITPLPEPPVVSLKVRKYHRAIKLGKNKTQSALEAGYADGRHTDRVERSQEFQELNRYYREVLLKEISLEDIAKINVRNMVQERDLGASNMAVKLALDRIDDTLGGGEGDRVIVVLSDS